MRDKQVQMLAQIADIVAKQGTCSRLQVGAIIAREGRVSSIGYNGVPKGLDHCHHNDPQEPCVNAVHAEANAIAWAARVGTSTEGLSMFTTHSPCLDCAKLIVNAGISELYFRDRYRRPEGLKLLQTVGIQLYRWCDTPSDFWYVEVLV